MTLKVDNWFVRNLFSLKTIVRIIFGVIWAIDGALKFAPGFVDSFPTVIKHAASGQPSWLSGWFAFWASITSSNPSFYVYSAGPRTHCSVVEKSSLKYLDNCGIPVFHYQKSKHKGLTFVIRGRFTKSLLGEVRHNCEVYCYKKLIPDYRCVMTWWNMSYISRAKLFFTSIIILILILPDII
jgi:hypothetical protein